MNLILDVRRSRLCIELKCSYRKSRIYPYAVHAPLSSLTLTMALSLFALKSLHSRASTVQDQLCANLSAIEVNKASNGVEYIFTTNHRSTAAIVTSCLSTILLCTWFTVHPNICGRRPTQWQVLRAKITLFTWALIMPEVVMMHECYQWFGAREIAKKMGSSQSFC